MLKLCCVLTFALVTLGGAVHAQTTWFVDTANCPGPGSGTLGDPFCLIQAGINAAINGDSVEVAPGTYNELINLLGKAITVRSSGGPAVTTIDGTSLGGSVITCACWNSGRTEPMAKPSKAFPIDATGRVLITEAADQEVESAKITVGTTAVELKITNGPKRRKLFVRNTANPEVVVFIGGDNVTTATGFPIYQFDELELDVDDDAVVKAVAASSGGEVRILEVE